MAYRIRLHDITIGWTDLEHGDASEGRAHGRFRAADGYELVQPIMRLYTEAVPERGGPTVDEEKLARYMAAADALKLELVDDSGVRVSTSLIRIHDRTSNSVADELEVEVQPTDDRFWKRWRPFS